MKFIPAFFIIATPIVALCGATETITKNASKQPFSQREIQNPIDHALRQLNAYATLQRREGVQNYDVAYAMRKALLMADLLIRTDGTFNDDLCPQVKAAFISSSPKEYEMNMAKILNQPSLFWQFLEQVKAPSDATSTGFLALRGLFSMKPSQLMTDRHAKVAVLAAMLAPYNQGPVGDCFAVSDVIRDHLEYYFHSAMDYRAIVMNGYVERPVDGSVDYFFFLPLLADEDMDRSFPITAAGFFPGTSDPLLNAPGFSAALSLMGAENVDLDFMKNVMQQLTKNAEGDQIQVTPKQVIAAMAQTMSAKTPNADIGTLCTLGEYGFSGLTNNPILRGVEAAFAGMAEDRLNDSTRGNINSAVDQALQDTWKQLQNRNEAASFHNVFNQNLNASYRLIYNLNIPLSQVSSDGSSTDGGFQLYQRIAGHPTQMGKRVATPEDLRRLLLDVINQTVEQMGSTPDAQAMGYPLIDVINTDAFLKNVLWDYDSANQKQADPVTNYLKLSRTPMQSCDGDNPFEVADIDTQTNYDNHVQTYTPGNAKDLIAWVLNVALKAPQELIPMDSPQHAFDFVPTNPDIMIFVQKKMPVSQWLQNMLVIPGMHVSKWQIDFATQKKVADETYAIIGNELPDVSAYHALVQQLSQGKWSCRDYANRFVAGLSKLLGADLDVAAQIALTFDGVLLENLPANQQAILNSSAIRFALTNWNEGTSNIYFCSYFNPRTEKIGFGTILEDKTNLQPMDEDAWVNNQQWDVNLSPFAPMMNAQ